MSVVVRYGTRETSFIDFFIQAEDGIRDTPVTGVQTCALPISTFERTLATTIDYPNFAE